MPVSAQHLRVAQEANAASYRHTVQTSIPGECWDVVVLTATNEKQAEGYRQELAIRHRGNGPAGAFFPAIQKSIVVADPPGKRAGSGGATLGVMKTLRSELGIDAGQLRQLRILLIHSGGQSQRLPMYSSLGKIFSPLPLLRPDGQIATLFDHLYITLSGLPDKMGPGMLVLAGDVFLLFDHRHVTPPAKGVTAITMRVPAELGSGHGVFVTDERGRIRSTLQKVSTQQMQTAGACDSEGNILIDTGILFFDSGAATQLAKLAGAGNKPGLQERSAGPIDLYEDITLALASDTARAAYIACPDAGMRKELWKTFHGIGFQTMEVEGEFLHLGTTLQFRDAMIGRSESPAAELFQQNVLAYSQWKLPAGRRVYHSALLRNAGSSGEVGEGSVIEHSILGSACRIGNGCVVSQVVAVNDPLSLPDNLLLFQVPVRLQAKLLFAQVLCGVEDDFKGRFMDGKCRYLNAPIDLWMKRHGVDARTLWPDTSAEKRTLWNARLFPATAARDASSQAMWQASATKARASTVKHWAGSPRVSMAIILESAEPQALIEHREVVAAYLQSGQITERIRLREIIPADDLLNHHSTLAAYAAAEKALHTFADQATNDPQEALQQARAYWTIAQILSRPDHPDPAAARPQLAEAMQTAFARVAMASELGHRRVGLAVVRPQPVPVGTVVEATSPVRLDLTGGWSDTPPYCFEEGGHVVNVSIDLDGRPPVRAIVKRIPGNRLLLESRDLGKTMQTSVAELRGQPITPHDPFALHRLALELSGWFSGKATGLHLITECRVPKGSGLGTSSILGATLLAALLRAGNIDASAEDLIERTLVMEQRLSTGGGWQDQVGGIFGGIKSTISAPGIPQRPVVEQIPLSDERLDAIEQRLVVYFSGQQRLARDILRRVEGQWLARNPSAVQLKTELKASSAALRQALLRTDWDGIAGEINRYWRIKKQLYPGSTTPAIDVLLLSGRLSGGCRRRRIRLFPLPRCDSGNAA